MLTTVNRAEFKVQAKSQFNVGLHQLSRTTQEQICLTRLGHWLPRELNPKIDSDNSFIGRARIHDTCMHACMLRIYWRHVCCSFISFLSGFFCLFVWLKYHMPQTKSRIKNSLLGVRCFFQRPRYRSEKTIVFGIRFFFRYKPFK